MPLTTQDESANAEAGARAPRSVKRTLNEAAHKLEYRPARQAADGAPRQPSAALRRATDDDRDVQPHAGKAILALGALGIVFGDIGTSPLYTVQTIFTAHRDVVHTNVAGVYGIVSLIFWALIIVVSVKYAGFIMRAHNHGDGGIMALAALVRRHKLAHASALITLGVFGAGLFFGDGMITPAISVMSSVEGLNIAAPGLAHLEVPISLVILLGLFFVQSRGTGAVGWLFGPVVLLWFVVIAVLGGREVVAHPGVLQGLSPVWGLRFLVDHGGAAFLTLGAVVLAVTGAEALYADRGHFGAGPIRMTWFIVVFPAVMLSYLGQAALIKAHPHAISNPFFLLVPGPARVPMVVLATMATIIASQAAITGSFSVAKQALQLGLLPRLRIVHTSELEGQIYVPVINWALCAGVAALVLGFEHSAKLADIYGVAVTGTFVLNTILFLAVARGMWRTAWFKLVGLGTLLLVVEVAFFASNLAKVEHGGWLPLGVGLAIGFVMLTWRRGHQLVSRNRAEQEGSLTEFLASLCTMDPPLRRLPGTAVFPNPSGETTPLALRAEVAHSHGLHEKVVIVSVQTIGVPHVDGADQQSTEWLGEGLFKIIHVILRVGYRDDVNVPRALAVARKRGLLERALDLEHASYFVSRMTIIPGDGPGMGRRRKSLFIAMARNASSPISHFGLPRDRTVTMGSEVSL